MRQIIAEVPADAAVISYGLCLAGDGVASIDGVTAEAIHRQSPTSSAEALSDGRPHAAGQPPSGEWAFTI